MAIMFPLKPSAAWLHPSNIRYLAFKGGGGKGVAFLGSLGWLENHKAPLPVNAASTILGLSGASAGAMTALLVSLGYSSDQLVATFGHMDVSDLIDEPEYGTVRCVSRQKDHLRLANFLETDAAAVDAFPVTVLTASFAAILRLTGDQSVTPGSLYDTLLTTTGYAECLIGDSGFMTGTSLRNWLMRQLANSPWWRSVPLTNMRQLPDNPAKITFGQLYAFGGWHVQLAVAATNLTTGRPVVFSQRTTPDFPVVEAVAMSASFPGLFKPTWVSSTAPFGKNIALKQAVGWYADGGITNNLPMHVFDGYPGTLSADPYLDTGQSMWQTPPATLNEFMLGIVLEEGEPPGAAGGGLAQGIEDPTMTQGLPSTLEQVLNALEFASNMGQVHSPDEYRQIATAYSGSITTTNLVPSTEDQDLAYKYSFLQMDKYYQGRV
jgi:predicted acylesterase/phospholipase RssA